MIKCRCGCIEFEVREKPPHVGLYCKTCGTWIKWIPQSQDDGEIASRKQQDYAVSLFDKWRSTGNPMTKSQAGGIIKLFGKK